MNPLIRANRCNKGKFTHPESRRAGNASPEGAAEPGPQEAQANKKFRMQALEESPKPGGRWGIYM
jgi:hypothetical protein